MGLSLDSDLLPAAHPNAEALLAPALDWICTFVDLERGVLARQLRRVRIHELAARTGLALDGASLELLHSWYLWLFLNDDLADPVGDGHDPRLLEALHAPMMSALDGHRTAPHAPPEARMLADLLRRLAARWPHGIGRLVEDTRAYLQANRWEALLRSEGRVPTLAAYTHLRHDAGAAQTAFDLFPILDRRFRARPESLRHPVFRTLEVLANQHISWVNDILGFEREQAEGHDSNVVAVLAVEHSDVEAALRDAVDRCNGLMAGIVETERDWIRLQAGRDPGADRLVEMMVRWTRGSLDWHLRTRRYLEGHSVGLRGNGTGQLLRIRPELLAMRQTARRRCAASGTGSG